MRFAALAYVEERRDRPHRVTRRDQDIDAGVAERDLIAVANRDVALGRAAPARQVEFELGLHHSPVGVAHDNLRIVAGLESADAAIVIAMAVRDDDDADL